MKLLARIWNEEAGALISIEIVLVATILVIGVIVGLEAVRGAVDTELADVAQAVANINQSYSYSGVAGHNSSTAGSSFRDRQDQCDSYRGRGFNSKCVSISTRASSESSRRFRGGTGGQGFPGGA